MSESATTVLIVVLGAFAGLVGSMAGVGGGIIITPVLVIYFDVPILHAIGASLIAIIATSTATSAVQLKRPLADIRLGLVLELATTVGAAVAAVLVIYVNRRALAGLFAAVLLVMAATLVRRAWQSRREPAVQGVPEYHVQRYDLGLSASLGAGALSGLLGIGGGPVKVPVMYIFMGVPLRVATATSNFMIGVTAAASAYIYYGRGDVRLELAAPVVLGVLAGSMTGARLAARVPERYVILLLVVIMFYLSAQMALRVAGGGG